MVCLANHTATEGLTYPDAKYTVRRPESRRVWNTRNGDGTGRKKIMPTGLFRRVPYPLPVSGRSGNRFESRHQAAPLDDSSWPPEGGTQNDFKRFFLGDGDVD